MCRSTECNGCAYSKLPALFHSGPHRECYRRFFTRYLPWNVLGRVVNKARRKIEKLAVVRAKPRKEVSHEGHGHALTVTSR